MHNEWKTRAGRQLSWEERIKLGWEEGCWGGAWRELEGLGLEEGLNADDAKSARATMPGHSDAETPQRGPFPTPSAFDPNEMTNGERLR